MAAPKTIKFKLIHPDAKLPTRGSEYAAGLDIYAVEDFTIPPTRKVGDITATVGHYKASTGLVPEIPPGMFGAMKPRSGHGFQSHVSVFEGTIDADFRGEMKVLMYNYSSVPICFKKGDRIAQLIIQRYENLEPVIAKDLSETERGEGGFGHTGK